MDILRRFLLIVLLFTVLIFCSFSGGQGESETGPAEAVKKSTIQFMHLLGNPSEKAIIDEVVGLFESSTPNISIEQQVFESKAYHTKILQLLAGDDPPDVYLAYPGFKTYDLVDRGVLLPLNDLWENNNFAQFFSEGTKTAVSYKGKQWNLPWVTHANIVLYNKKVFKDIGVNEPTTLAEFETICDKVKSTGKYPLVSGWNALFRAAYPFDMLMPAIGGIELFQRLAALEEDWDNESVRELLAIWKRWVEEGYWYPDPRARSWAEGLGLLAEELTAMDFMGTYGMGVLEDVGMAYGIDYDLFIFPQIDPKHGTTLTGPFDAWSIPLKAHNSKGALEFFAFLATPEAQSVRARAGGLVLNKLVTDYGPAMLKVKKAVEEGAAFQPGFFQASPPLGLQQINHGIMPDFYDDPDIEEFIRRANKTREQFQSEKK
jgi:multiple sugar transport system substrate-binding protein